jgi:hypothetical protein
MKDTATQPANENNNVMNETKKLTAEEFLTKSKVGKWLRDENLPAYTHAKIIEAMEEHTQNQLDSYKDGLRKEIEWLLTSATSDRANLNNAILIKVLSLLDKPQD